jgi:hypothetical protein
MNRFRRTATTSNKPDALADRLRRARPAKIAPILSIRVCVVHQTPPAEPDIECGMSPAREGRRRRRSVLVNVTGAGDGVDQVIEPYTRRGQPT